MSVLDVVTDGHVRILTLNRPEARNAVNAELAAALSSAIDDVEGNQNCRVAILRASSTGASPVFCAGADLRTINEGRIRDLSIGSYGFAGLTDRVRSKPMIVAVDGLATAGGFELVLATDLVVASSQAAFGLAEVRRGLIAGAGGLYRLPWAIGEREATRAILTGEPLSAERAHVLGLVTELTAPHEVDAAALALAHQIAAGGPLAVARSLEVIKAARALSEDELREMSLSAMREVLRSDDVREGVNAFLERRQP